VHLPWEPRSSERGGVDFGFARDAAPTPDSGARLDHPQWVREVVTFPAVDGTPLEAWAYLPRRVAAAAAAGGGGGADAPPSPSSAPVVVIGQGLGAQKDMGLPAYSEAFASAGLVAFAFDYRGFGGSGGEPRHWVDPRRHVRDWRSAVEFVSRGGLLSNANVSRHLRVGAGASPPPSSSLPPVATPDGTRVGLWGMSYSGGHVLVTAATPGMGADTGGFVRAVVANEPFLTGRAALARAPLERGPLRVLRLFSAAASDLIRHALGMPAVYVRLAAPLSDTNALALLQLKDSDLIAQRQMAAERAAGQARADALLAGATAEAAARAAADASARVHAAAHRPRRQGGWRNVVAARFLAAMIGYEPLLSVPRVRVPLFLRVALQDHICPPEIAEEAARLYSGAELTIQRHDVTHIEGLVHGARPSELAPVVAFYRRHLVEAAAGGALAGAGEGTGADADVLEVMEA
jgi:pimeloyl-ACP methyl ester carboxylesterase